MKIPKLSMILSIFLLIAVLSSCSSPARPLTSEELLDLGEKYLLELNYEEAVMQFTKLIEIEPKNPRGYLGLAEAYAGLDDTDKAVTALENGLKQLPENQEIKAMLERLTKSDITEVESDQETATEQRDETMSDPIPENIAIIIDDIKNALKKELWQKAEELANSELLVSFLEERNESHHAFGDMDRITLKLNKETNVVYVDFASGEKNDSNKFINAFYYLISYWSKGPNLPLLGYSVSKIEITEGKVDGLFQQISFDFDGRIIHESMGKVENGLFSGTTIDYGENSETSLRKWIDGYEEWDGDFKSQYTGVTRVPESWLAQ